MSDEDLLWGGVGNIGSALQLSHWAPDMDSVLWLFGVVKRMTREYERGQFPSSTVSVIVNLKLMFSLRLFLDHNSIYGATLACHLIMIFTQQMVYVAILVHDGSIYWQFDHWYAADSPCTSLGPDDPPIRDQPLQFSPPRILVFFFFFFFFSSKETPQEHHTFAQGTKFESKNQVWPRADYTWWIFLMLLHITYNAGGQASISRVTY